MKIGDTQVDLGIMFRREHPPEHLPQFARSAEAAGFDELWLVEDCFFGSGIASSAVALALTNSITVGLGILPAVVRNPVFAAMELATLERLYPGRFLPGIGHGVAEWMHQIGAFPPSQLKALEETSVTVKRLLDGERFSFDGQQIHLTDVELVHPPAHSPPISLGVRGQKSLQLAGRVADGTILAEYASPQYVRWAREQIAVGQAAGGRSEQHRLTVFVMAFLGDDLTAAFAQAKARIVAAIYRQHVDAQLEPMGILAQVVDMRNRHAVEAELPDEWVRQLTMVGSAEDCAEAVRRYAEAGADLVVLVPPPEQSLTMPDTISAHLMRYLT